MADNTTLNVGSGGDVIASDDISGVKYQRTKTTLGADAANDGDVSKANPMPVIVQHTGRTELRFYATGVASGTTGTETAITLTKSSGTSAVSTAVSFVVTSAKRFKITQIVLASRGNATATAQVTTFNIRLNTAGAVTTTSTPLIIQLRTATPATALAWDRVQLIMPPDGIEIVGDGTLQWGITANAVFVTNAPTWDVLVIGYEY
jgi:hypothetical protein